METTLNKEKGQLLLTIILVLTIALAIGLSVVQKSLVDISTATKTEQSSQAFSAAEAGVEKALLSPQGGTDLNFSLDNTSSNISVKDEGKWPLLPQLGQQQDGLEFPPLAREDTAQVWFADPASTLPSCSPNASSSNPVCYKRSSFEVYWGSSKTDVSAISLKFIYYNGTAYVAKTFLYDPDPARGASANFLTATCDVGYPGTPSSGFTVVKTNLGTNRAFYCKQTIDTGITITGSTLPILVRIRLLYNTESQSVAVRAVDTCGRDCSIPPQMRTITSTGLTGNIQRKIQLTKQDNTVLPYFDYAIFSAGDIIK